MLVNAAMVTDAETKSGAVFTSRSNKNKLSVSHNTKRAPKRTPRIRTRERAAFAQGVRVHPAQSC
eukprot:609051-Pyramimonas_sp.AAC.1